MDPKDSLFLEILGIKAGAHGRFAIVAVLLTFLVAGAGYLLGHTCVSAWNIDPSCGVIGVQFWL